MRSPTNYLKCRNGIWYARVQRDGKDTAVSLGTRDKLEAMVKATDMIKQHRAILLNRKPRTVTEWLHRYKPGQLHTDPETGGQIFATESELHYLAHNGAPARIEQNGGPVLARVGRIKDRDIHVIFNQRMLAAFPDITADAEDTRPTVAAKSGDDQLIDFYISHNNFAPGSQAARETLAVWSLFKSLVKNKSLKNCDRDDGRKLVAHLEAQGDKSGTVKKKVGRLGAACALAIKEGKLHFNPFAGIAQLKDDKTIRLPFDDADMAVMFANLGALSPSDQLLFRVVASTGMRLGEAFEIDREYTEKGVRFCIVGTKNAQSKRRVPFPASLLPHLPEKITAPLFAGDPNQASRRLGLWLDNMCGIADERKVAAHSLRHRAQDVMRAEGCPPEVREELFGREKMTVSAGYGRGHPVVVLKKWIDRVLPVQRTRRPTQARKIVVSSGVYS